jgi:hypothetical protein
MMPPLTSSYQRRITLSSRRAITTSFSSEYGMPKLLGISSWFSTAAIPERLALLRENQDQLFDRGAAGNQ